MENPRIVFPGLPDVSLSVRRFRVEERASALFRVQLTAVSPDPGIDLEALTGARAAFLLTVNVEKVLLGVVEQARFTRFSEDESGLATYEVTVVPSLWRLAGRIQNRLFQHRSIPDIVGSILAEHRVAHAFALDGARYPALELRTQYGESDLAFVRRLLEEAGITFTFAEPDPGGIAAAIAGDVEADMRVVFSDDPGSARERPGPPLPFTENTSLSARELGPFVTNVTVTATALPGRVTLRDHDFRRPRLALYASADGPEEDELPMEHYLYTHGAFLEELSPRDASIAGTEPHSDDRGVARRREARGQRLSRLALEAMHAERTVIAYDSGVVDLSPGTVFRLGGHPRPDLSAKSALLAIASVLEGEVATPDSWRLGGAAVPAARPFRPARATPKPRMQGVHTAVVVGAASAPPRWHTRNGAVDRLEAAALDGNEAAARLVDNDIYTDEHGRVRVQFPWDREGGFNSGSSAWMRVSQGWAGRGYGMFTVPRVGHEVLVAFVDGDPDCPIVVGRVHNALEPPPFKLPENKTVSTWRSASSPGGGGFNELRFDDALGRESVYLQAERDMDQLVKNDARCAVGGDATTYVQNDDARAVGRDRTEVVNANSSSATGLSRVDVVGVNRSSTVGAEDHTVVGSRWSVTVARGLTGHLTREIERAATSAGSVLRSAAGTVLGLLPNDPRAAAAESALSDLGKKGLGKLRDAVAFLGGFHADPGPPPTSIEMTDRQIKLGTGEASITLDGPNVVIQAQGNITLHALGHVSVLGEREVAVGGQDKVALVSAKDDVVVQAGKNVHLNPFGPPAGAPRAASLEEGGALRGRRCGTCGSRLTVTPEGELCVACRDAQAAETVAAGEDEPSPYDTGEHAS